MNTTELKVNLPRYFSCLLLAKKACPTRQQHARGIAKLIARLGACGGQNTLVAEIYVQRDSSEKKAAEVRFTNTYTAPIPTPVPAAASTAELTTTPKTRDNFPPAALTVVAVITAATFGGIARCEKSGNSGNK